MPIYEYRCENGHLFEVFQPMSDDPVTKCEECGAPVQRVFHPVAVHFKGSGFHNTDYKNKSKTGKDSKDPSKSDSGSSDSKSDSSSKPDSKKSDPGSKSSDSKTKAKSSSD